jgi:hypothetical protein
MFPMGMGCELLAYRNSANQAFPILETHHIPPPHTERTMLILVCVISIEERVAEPLLFGVPSFTLKRRTRLCFLPSTPFNARCDGFGLIFHGSPPLLDRTSAGTPSDIPQRGCQGINTACPLFLCLCSVPGVLDVPISCRGSMARHGDDDRILDEGRLGESEGLSFHPKTNCPVRQDW